MSYISTKFCELCDEHYDWAAPECPGCVARNAAYRQEYKMQNIQKEFLHHLNMVQTTLAHLLQDGDVTDSGLDAVNNLLFITEQLQKKYGDG